MQDGITREDNEEAAVAARADGPNVAVVMRGDGVPLIVMTREDDGVPLIVPFDYILGSNERWMDPTDMGPLRIGEHDSNAVTTSGGDGGRGGAAPPGVGSSSWAKGDGKGQVRYEYRGGMTPVVQPPDTNLHQSLRREYEAQDPRFARRSLAAIENRARRQQQKTVAAWKRRFEKKQPRLETEVSEN